MIFSLTSSANKVIKNLEANIEYPVKKPHPKLLDPYKEEIIKLLEENLNGTRIHEELRSKGIKTSYSTVKKYISSIKKRQNIFVRIQTKAGEEAQVDFEAPVIFCF